MRQDIDEALAAYDEVLNAVHRPALRHYHGNSLHPVRQERYGDERSAQGAQQDQAQRRRPRDHRLLLEWEPVLWPDVQL